LLLLSFVEMQGGPAWLIHLICLVFLAGRSIHAYGVSQVHEDYRLRTTGMAITFAVIAVTALVLGRVLIKSRLVTAIRSIKSALAHFADSSQTSPRSARRRRPGDLVSGGGTAVNVSGHADIGRMKINRINARRTHC
jgi:hypothetical protein